MPDATFVRPDLTTFTSPRRARPGGAVGNALEPDRAVLACRVVGGDRWCRRCGARAALATAWWPAARARAVRVAAESDHRVLNFQPEQNAPNKPGEVVRSTAVASRRPPSWLGSGGQVKGVREAAEQVAAPAQHLDHAGRDRAIGGELTGDEPADAGPAAKARSTGPSPRVTSRVEPSTRMSSSAGPKRAAYAVAGRFAATCWAEGGAEGHGHRVGGDDLLLTADRPSP